MASQQAARRLILTAQAITRHATIQANVAWNPRVDKLLRLLASLTYAAERGDPAATAMLLIVERTTVEAIAWARAWRPTLLDDAARAEEAGRLAAEQLLGQYRATRGPYKAQPALTSIPLANRVDAALTGIVTATTTRVHQAAAFGVTEGPRQVARRIRDAFGTPIKRATLIARTEMLTAYRDASIKRYAENPLLSEWVWVAALDGRTCPVCWAMHGSIHPLSEPFGSHAQCRCAPMPVVPGASLPTTGPDLFSGLATTSQARILGPSRLALYKQGVGIDQMVSTRANPVYGVSRGLTPVGALKQRAA